MSPDGLSDTEYHPSNKRAADDGDSSSDSSYQTDKTTKKVKRALDEKEKRRYHCQHPGCNKSFSTRYVHYQCHKVKGVYVVTPDSKATGGGAIGCSYTKIH